MLKKYCNTEDNSQAANNVEKQMVDDDFDALLIFSQKCKTVIMCYSELFDEPINFKSFCLWILYIFIY